MIADSGYALGQGNYVAYICTAVRNMTVRRPPAITGGIFTPGADNTQAIAGLV